MSRSDGVLIVVEDGNFHVLVLLVLFAGGRSRFMFVTIASEEHGFLF